MRRGAPLSRPALCAASLVVLLSSCFATAQAQELALAVESECPGARIADEVQAALGRSLGSDSTEVWVRVALRRRATSVRAVVGIERDGGRSERILSARTCERAVQAVALVIALALDAEPSPSPATHAGSTVVPSVEVEERVAAPRLPDPSHRDPATGDSQADEPRVRDALVRPEPHVDGGDGAIFVVLAGAMIDVGSLRGGNAGVHAGFGLGLGPRSLVRVELLAIYFPETRALSASPGAGVDVTLVLGALRVGRLVPIAGPLAVGLNLELQAGVARGSGSGVRVQQPSTAWLPRVLASLGLAAEVALFEPFSLRFSGSIGAAVVNPVFLVRGTEEVRPGDGVVAQAAASVVVALDGPSTRGQLP